MLPPHPLHSSPMVLLQLVLYKVSAYDHTSSSSFNVRRLVLLGLARSLSTSLETEGIRSNKGLSPERGTESSSLEGFSSAGRGETGCLSSVHQKKNPGGIQIFRYLGLYRTIRNIPNSNVRKRKELDKGIYLYYLLLCHARFYRLWLNRNVIIS